jgi:uncharacterized membrane protein HdeD (DUF308 family)
VRGVKVAFGFVFFVVGVILLIDGVLHTTDPRRLSAAYPRSQVWAVFAPGALVILAGLTLVTLGLALGGLIELERPGWLKR